MSEEKSLRELYYAGYKACKILTGNERGSHDAGLETVASESIRRHACQYRAKADDAIHREMELVMEHAALLKVVEEMEFWFYNPDENANARFERIGEAYYRDTFHLRPGKSDPERNTSDPENVKRFDDWYKSKSLAALSSLNKWREVNPSKKS